MTDGAELLLTLQDAAQGAARRHLREAARREAAKRAEAERKLVAERAEAERKLAEDERVLAVERRRLSALRGEARRESMRECLHRSAKPVLVLALVALVVYFVTAPCEDGAHLDGWDRSRE